MSDPNPRREAVGETFSLAAMVGARDLTFEAVRRIAAEIRPGVTEGRGDEIAQEVLEAMGMDRLWHKNVVRFGPGTLETFHGEYQPDYVLQANDIFFVDLGAVFDGHEGDAGDTFVVGDDAEMHACAQACRDLWHEVAGQWRDHGVTGDALYRFAKDRTEAKGWTLNWEVKGHRVSDFPHAIYKAGALGDFEGVPVSGLWILEIQIAHPTRPIGAFYEDLLIST
ncbi:MAG: aminopeptidase P family protein [Alphaproteobacteria bacterium]|nr:aminopeptidase P family protein [Alphaproteobacteria bacterium]MBU1515453.1 aminopeptidase P family protein [Alphaproteobacteria bacterium]MBU2095451.1 aminopeptidase P family protein [Alphaproteobacteria bacterium]MBU2150693.1 aminopeptidase P family protein [Alphaproteobacteria bacterium]MBU2306957.1 aminopeptidase P family protein [Alphaproteobacteria bacterium]